MRAKIISAAVAATAVAAVTVAVTALGSQPAGATDQLFVGYAGGSLVRALDNTVTSDLTAASEINNTGLVSDDNSAANVVVNSLLTATAVQTSTTSRQITGGYEVVSRAHTAGANLLGGAITVSAIDTTTTSRVVNGVTSSNSKTELVGLKIPGVKVPVDIPENFKVSIPGVATVILNYKLTAANDPNIMTIGAGLYIGLLKPFGRNPVGAAVTVNLTYAALGPAQIPDSGHIISGKAFGTQVTADVGSLAHVKSDPTAPVGLPAGGTSGQPKTSSVAGVNLTSLAKVGAVATSVQGVNTNSVRDAQASARVAGVNLFNGFIKADAVTATATAHDTGSGVKTTGASQLVKLVIGGKAITVNASPNTVLNLGIGKITINQQVKAGKRITVRALDIVLGKAGYGFPAGAEVQVAVATAAVN